MRYPCWRLSFLLLLCLTTGLPVLAMQAPLEILHRERSLYRNLMVTERGNERCLVFPVGGEGRRQTCMDVTQPEKMILPYAPMAMVGLLVNPAPKRILIIGLGGGTLPTALRKLLPEADIDIAELDQAVVKAAKDYFNFTEDERMRATVQDGRVFIKRAALARKRYDYIFLDAFDGDYIPEHLMTKEFLEEASALLSFSGVLAANTFSTSRLYDHESVTYQQVFRDLVTLHRPDSGNRIILARMTPLPDDEVLLQNARELVPGMEHFGFDPVNLIGYIGREPDWDESVRPLTDEYSPANLLRGR